MNDHDFNLKGHVKLVSVKPIWKAADYASIGGFSISTKSEEIIFDWCDSTGYTSVDEKGRFVIEWSLSDFDMEYFKDCNYDDEFDLNKIAVATIDEVQYGAADEANNEKIHYDMDLVEFVIYAYQGSSPYRETYAFSPEQIEAYNQKVKAERNERELVTV